MKFTLSFIEAVNAIRIKYNLPDDIDILIEGVNPVAPSFPPHFMR